MDLTIEIRGLAALDQALRDFPNKVQTRMLGRALRAGAKVWKARAKALAPVRTGTLKRNIVVRAVRKQGAVSRIGVGIKTIGRHYANTASNRRSGRVGKSYRVYGDAYYGRFVELGTKKMAAKSFLRPALSRHAEDAIGAFKAALKQQIEAEHGGH